MKAPAKDFNEAPLPSLLLICGLIGTSLIVYWPGLSGGFLLDDFDNLNNFNDYGGITNATTALHFIFGNTSGALGRPVSMLSFLINDQYWPGDPWSFKYTNLMIHIICGLLILLLVLKILPCTSLPRQYHLWAAGIASALWLLHPLNLSTTLYVIQRMTQLMTLFTLAGLLLYCIGRTRVGQHQHARKGLLLMTLGLTIFGALATFSKENGVLILLYIAVLEYTLFHHLPKPPTYKKWFAIFIITPGLLFLGYVAKSIPEYLNIYASRDFTLIERLLTEARILIDYLYKILLPQIKGTGLIHDDIVLSQGLLTPISTLFSLILIIALVVAAFRLRVRQPILSLAILWFFGGHVLESTIIPLELYFEHRNYLPMLGPLLAVGYYLAILAEKFPRKRVQIALKATPLLLVAFSGLLSYQSAKAWGSTLDLVAVWAYEHPDSMRAQRIYGQVLGKVQQYDAAIDVLDSAYGKYPEDIGLPIAMLEYACASGVSPRYSVEDIIERSKKAKYNDGIRVLVQDFINATDDSSCDEVPRKDRHKLLTALENVSGIKNAELALLLFMHSDVYILERQLSPAIQLLDRAFKHQKISVIPIKQARLLASAGLYDEALNYLQIAQELESQKPRLKQLPLPILERLEMEIRTAKSGLSLNESE